MSEETKKPNATDPYDLDNWNPPEGGGGDYAKVEYLKVDDGETAHIRILSTQPTQAFVASILVDGKRHPVSVDQEAGKRVKAHDHKIRKVNAVAVLDRRDSKVKLWEFSDTRLGEIFAIAKEWELHPTHFDIALSRKGKKLDTKWTVSLSKNQGPLTEEEASLELPNLAEYYAPNVERVNALLNGEVPSKKDRKDVDETKTEEKVETTADVSGGINPLGEGDDVV